MNLNLNGKEIDMIIDALGKNSECFVNCKKEILKIDKILKKMHRALKPTKTSSRKAKGRSLQQWVCKAISRMIGIPYDQQDDNCEIHSREMGQSGVDIVLRGEARKLFKFDIECKNTEKLNLYNTIEQAKANNLLEERKWLVVHKKNRTDPIVIMDWNVFEELWNGK
jgi:hypothetical protein